ncbi:potassium/proton antiporter [Stenotrophobium rhamnosiphilum]|uniref:Potassium/proton antiporter n=2 Tax=Stenotrophobium rhamnosiphilum TaxID=2029166 RepID=A0A2T5MIY6_9GAMM|nr:potassium/proton antiporter [Stenotrophobium rhamnosiphilum]
MDFVNQILFAAGLLFLVSILATVITPRLGVPLLFVFIIIGMIAGEDGPGNIHFADFRLTNLAGTAALAVILFDGGMRTSFKTFRVGLGPALSLATVGVLITMLVVGWLSSVVLDLPLAQGMLLGAIVSSTDAAAVFSLLSNRTVSLNSRVTSVLEIESGTNDPMAVFLTLGVIAYLQSPDTFTAQQFLFLLVEHMGIGGVLGLAGGWLLARALNRLQLNESLYPVFALFSCFLLFGLTALLGGSGFLAVYLAGLLVGNRKVRALASIRRFHDGIAWMAQIGMFLILGLLVSPHKLLTIALPALLIGLVLILAARPLAVVISLLPFRFPWREQAFISWVGLRGSVPIVLATFPWIAGIENAGLIFNIAFFIVLVSLLLQGWSVPLAAQMLKLYIPRTGARVKRLEVDLPGQSGYEIVSYKLPVDSSHIGRRPKELPIRDHSRIIAVTRSGHLLSYREWGVLQAGDFVSLLVAETDLERLDTVFKAKRQRADAAASRQFFGEFEISLEAAAKDLAESYGVKLPESTAEFNVGQLVLKFLPRPVVGDRLRLGHIELVVRRMEGGELREIGVRLPRE